jgi:ABC-type antimicrobial peptide transport system permease subunit
MDIFKGSIIGLVVFLVTLNAVIFFARTLGEAEELNAILLSVCILISVIVICTYCIIAQLKKINNKK